MHVETAGAFAAPVERLLRRLAAVQPDAADRLAVSRLTTGLAIIRTVHHLPPGDVLAEYAEILDRAEERATPRRKLSPAAYDALRAATIVSVGAWMLGVEHPVVKVAANASFAALQRHVVEFHEEMWSYNSHLNAFLALLSLTDSRGAGAARPAGEPLLDAAVLSAMQAVYATVYLQSGVSKLAGAGWRWADGNTLRAGWGEFGTPLGKRLAVTDPRLASVASVAALALELGFVPALLLAWRHRAWLGAASALFHTSVKATMDISFWHLSWYSAPLFAAPPSTVRRVATAAYGRTGRAAKVAVAVAVAAAVVKPLGSVVGQLLAGARDRGRRRGLR